MARPTTNPPELQELERSATELLANITKLKHTLRGNNRFLYSMAIVHLGEQIKQQATKVKDVFDKM